MPDTIWHIKGVDTFLIEIFPLNGRLRTRHWREDSIYSFDNQGNIEYKNFLFKKDKKNYLPDEFGQLDYGRENISYFPNGKI